MDLSLNYIYALQCLMLLLLAAVCWCGPMSMRKRQFAPFALHALFLGLGVAAGCLLTFPGTQKYTGADICRFFFFWTGLLFLADFSVVRRTTKTRTRILFCGFLILLSTVPFLIMRNFSALERTLSLLMIGIPSFAASAVTLWSIGNSAPLNQIQFKSAAIFQSGNFLIVVLQLLVLLRLRGSDTQSLRDMSAIFSCLSLLCSFACSISFFLTLRELKLHSLGEVLKTFLIPPLFFCFFLGLLWVLPSMLFRFGCMIETGRATDNAGILMRDLAGKMARARSCADRLAAEPWIGKTFGTDLLSNVHPGRISNLCEFGNAESPAIFFSLDREGVCMDSSNRVSPKSFPGEDFSFRRYFRKALLSGWSSTVAFGVLTDQPSVFASRRVEDPNGKVLGVIVARYAIGNLIRELSGMYAAILSPHGTVFYSSALPPAAEPWKIAQSWNDRFFDTHFPPTGDHVLVTGYAACPFFDVPGWRIAVALRTALPFLLYVVGQYFVLLFWLVCLCGYSIHILQLRMRLRLAESNLWRETVFNKNSIGILIVDAMRNVIEANETFLGMVGYSLAELRNRGLEIIYPNGSLDHSIVSEAYRMVRGEKRFDGSVTFRKKSGELFVCRLSGRPLKPEQGYGPANGSIVWSVSTGMFPEIQDASGSAGASEDVFSPGFSSVLLKRVFEDMPDGIQVSLLNPEGVFMSSGDSALAARIGQGEKIYILSSASLFSGPLPERMFKQCVADRRTVSFRGTRRSERGSVLMVRYTFTPIFHDRNLIAVRVVSHSV